MASSRRTPQTKASKKKQKQERDPLKRMVTALAEARREHHEAESSLEMKTILFQQKNKALIERVEATHLAVEMNDEVLRAHLLQVHKEKGITQVGPGLEVKIRQEVLIVDEPALRRWCIDNCTIFLEVDVKLITSIAKEVPKFTIPYIARGDLPTAYIAKDLAKTVEALG